MTDWPPLPPQDDAPVPGKVFVLHILSLRSRIESQHDDAKDIRSQLSGISSDIRDLSAAIRRFGDLKTWVTGSAAALGAALGGALLAWLTGGHG